MVENAVGLGLTGAPMVMTLLPEVLRLPQVTDDKVKDKDKEKIQTDF